MYDIESALRRRAMMERIENLRRAEQAAQESAEAGQPAVGDAVTADGPPAAADPTVPTSPQYPSAAGWSSAPYGADPGYPGRQPAPLRPDGYESDPSGNGNGADTGYPSGRYDDTYPAQDHPHQPYWPEQPAPAAPPVRPATLPVRPTALPVRPTALPARPDLPPARPAAPVRPAAPPVRPAAPPVRPAAEYAGIPGFDFGEVPVVDADPTDPPQIYDRPADDRARMTRGNERTGYDSLTPLHDDLSMNFRAGSSGPAGQAPVRSGSDAVPGTGSATGTAAESEASVDPSGGDAALDGSGPTPVLLSRLLSARPPQAGFPVPSMPPRTARTTAPSRPFTVIGSPFPAAAAAPVAPAPAPARTAPAERDQAIGSVAPPAQFDRDAPSPQGAPSVATPPAAQGTGTAGTPADEDDADSPAVAIADMLRGGGGSLFFGPTSGTDPHD